MKRLFSIFIIFLLAIPLIAVTNYETKILDDLKSQIESTHPAPYTHVSREEFERNIEALKKTWRQKSSEEQYFSLRRLIALIGDAHTKIYKQYENDKGLPFFVLPYGGHSIIVQTDEAYKELVGKELIAINGTKVSNIFQKLFPIISHDKEE